MLWPAAMLRVLILSTLFPNAAEPTLGVFVERQTLGLAALPDVEVEVVAPVGLPVWPLSAHPHYAGRARLPARETWKGLTIHRPRFRVWPRWGEARAARAMAKALMPLLRDIRRRFAFDVIAAEYFWPDGPAAMQIARALDIPFSIKARGSDIQYWGYRSGIDRQVAAAGKAADGLLAVSAALKDVMISLGMPRDKIRVHHTGVDLERFKPVDRAEARRGLAVGPGPLLITAGALIERKSQVLTLAALAHLPDATLLLVGDGEDRKALEKQARPFGERVRFLGARPHEELPGLLAAADAMILPSRAEGLANVWVEALACGTPIVISDVGGARDVVDRPDAGRLVPREPTAIAKAVRDLLADPPPAEKVRRAAERFDWDVNARALRDHLAAVAAKAAG